MSRGSETSSCSRVLDDRNGRPAAQFLIRSSLTRAVTCKFGFVPALCSRTAGSPLQDECRRFDPVSTHHSTCGWWRAGARHLAPALCRVPVSSMRDLPAPVSTVHFQTVRPGDGKLGVKYSVILAP